MALYPSPSSNRSVIDNGRSVWQRERMAALKRPPSLPQPARTCTWYYACKDASLEVQRLLQNEQGDNLEQSKNNTTFTFFFFCVLKCRWPVLLGVEFERVPTRAVKFNLNLAFKSAINICSSTTYTRVHVHPLPWRSEDGLQHFFWGGGGGWLCKHCSATGVFLSVDRTMNQVKTPSPCIKVLSFVRNLWNFEMTTSRCGFSDFLWTFSTHFIFVRKPPRVKYTKIKSKQNILDLQ